MMRHATPRHAAWLVLWMCVLVLAGCATKGLGVPASSGVEARWQGRLALKVLGTPVQAWAASFVLTGTPQKGELVLSTPLGGTIAQLRWSPGNASLQSADKREYFDSLDALALQATGTKLPIAALFAWLEGQAAQAPGWEVDLNRIEAGRLNARQTAEEPQSELKIILDR